MGLEGVLVSAVYPENAERAIQNRRFLVAYKNQQKNICRTPKTK